MSHEISTTSGQEEVFTVGGAWHGMGVIVEKELTAQEALKKAGLDWQVLQAPIMAETTTPGTQYFRIPDRVANYRLDPKGFPFYLGTVSNRYRIFQNQEVFDFAESLVGSGKAVYHSAGALKGGRRVWILVKLQDEMVIGTKDTVQQYLLLANGHDGGQAFRALFTPIRVVCWNTLSMALASQGGVTIYHVGDVKSHAKEAERVLGLAGTYYTDLQKDFLAMSKVQLTSSQVQSYIEELFPLDSKDEETLARIEEVQSEVLDNYKSGQGADLAGPTLWGAYNAITEWVDHTKWANAGRNYAGTTKLYNVVWGQGAMTKVAAFKEAASVYKTLTGGKLLSV